MGSDAVPAAVAGKWLGLLTKLIKCDDDTFEDPFRNHGTVQMKSVSRRLNRIWQATILNFAWTSTCFDIRTMAMFHTWVVQNYQNPKFCIVLRFLILFPKYKWPYCRLWQVTHFVQTSQLPLGILELCPSSKRLRVLKVLVG